MKISAINFNNRSFRGLTPSNAIKMNFEIALSRSTIFPNAIDRTADKLGRKYPELVDSVIFPNHKAMKQLSIMTREDAKELSFVQRLWTYLVKVPRDIKHSYNSFNK